jgi:hypothetical protein
MDTEILACRCGGGSPRRRVSDYIAPKTPATRAPAVTIAPGGPQNFCNKCGWVVKTVKYVDRNTKAIMEKTTCTNKQCQNYN